MDCEDLKHILCANAIACGPKVPLLSMYSSHRNQAQQLDRKMFLSIYRTPLRNGRSEADKASKYHRL